MKCDKGHQSNTSEPTSSDTLIKVFDFFSGCGGASLGFKLAGMENTFALDSDIDAEQTFKANFKGTAFFKKNIFDFKTEELLPLIESCKESLLLFCGCAPCQPFTKQRTEQREEDKRISLLLEFQRFVEQYLPEFVFVENVPGMQKISADESPLNEFIGFLADNKYSIACDIVASQNYGVPQYRRRLVLIASRLGTIKIPAFTHGPGADNPDFSTVREYVGHFPAIVAGESHPNIKNHRAAQLSQKNIERISVTPEGCGRESWPVNLELECHKKHSGHTDVYGRMRWNMPASGLTTRCISLSNGRFGHPEQNRAISIREAATLQTFPENFIFHGSLSSMARQIGNAVPVRLAKVFGLNFIDHLRQVREGLLNGKI